MWQFDLDFVYRDRLTQCDKAGKHFKGRPQTLCNVSAVQSYKVPAFWKCYSQRSQGNTNNNRTLLNITYNKICFNIIYNRNVCLLFLTKLFVFCLWKMVCVLYLTKIFINYLWKNVYMGFFFIIYYSNFCYFFIFL